MAIGSRRRHRHDPDMATNGTFLRAFQAIGQRHREPELMDQPGLDEQVHDQALRGLARINRFSRSAAILWPSLRALAREQSGRPLRVLDVACGGGDVTVALARKARQERLAVQMAGCDRSDTALEIARRHAVHANEPVEFFPHDVLAQPLPARFDAIICSLFLHHLDETDAVAVLRSMSQATSQVVLINDLVRNRRGYLLAVLGTRLLSRSPIVHVDGPLSVAGAFTPAEALQLCDQAGLMGATISRRWPQRFLLTWRR